MGFGFRLVASDPAGASRTGSGLGQGRKPVVARWSSCLSWTSEAIAAMAVPLQRLLTRQPCDPVRETGRNSHGVWRLSSTCVDREAGTRNVPASPPAGFLVYPLGGFVPHDPTRLDGSASEVCPSEVFPFAAQDPVSGVRPSCRWNRGVPRLQGAGRRRSVGAEAPRSSPGFRSFRAFSLDTHRDALSSRGPSMCFAAFIPEGKQATALRGVFCIEIRFPLSR